MAAGRGRGRSLQRGRRQLRGIRTGLRTLAHAVRAPARRGATARAPGHHGLPSLGDAVNAARHHTASADERGRHHRVLPRHPGALEQAADRRAIDARPHTTSASVTSDSSPSAPDAIAPITSPASRSADTRDSTTTVARRASASSVSRASGSWEPMAMTVAWSATSDPSNSGSRAVVAQQTMSAAATSSSTPCGVAADQVDVLDRPHGADRLDVAVGLRAAAEDEQAARVGAREPAHRERRDRRRAHVGERDPVDERDRRERGRVEHHAHALDAGLPADGHELDHRVCARGRGHHEQLAARERERAARRVGLGVQAGQERRFERVDRGGRAGGAARRRAAARKGRLIAGRSRCPGGRAGRARSGARRCDRPCPRPR